MPRPCSARAAQQDQALPAVPGPSAGRPRQVGGEPVREAGAGIVRTVVTRLGELVVLVLGYAVYAGVRQLHGEDESLSAYERAVEHGRDVSAIQRLMHLPSEAAVQRPLLDNETFLIAIGGFYGAAHFLVTVGTLVWLLLRRPAIYAWWRNCLGVLTAVAVACFAVYPTAPPRLLPVGDPERTVDTLDTVGGLWSYNHGVLERISDPFAAMPSLHLGWATWVAFAIYAAGAPSLRRALWCAAYPALTAVSVIVTGTHWYLDAVAGVALVYAVVAVGQRSFGRPSPDRSDASPSQPPEAVAVQVTPVS
jgi:membrane-associated phospholipid phosphatase